MWWWRWLLLAGSTCSISSSLALRRIAPPLYRELGGSPTLTRLLGQNYPKPPKKPREDDSYFFDPLQLATDENFARYREAELKHGRIAMLATLGMVVPSLLSDVSQLIRHWIPKLHFAIPSIKIQSGIEALKNLELVNYAQIMFTCGVLEAFVFVQQNPTDMPGDYGTGYLGVRDKGRHERSLVSELENGRLAMIAFVGQIVSEYVTGLGIVQQWETILTRGVWK